MRMIYFVPVALCLCLAAACRLRANDPVASVSPEATASPTPASDPRVNAGDDIHLALGSLASLSGSVSGFSASQIDYRWSFAGLPHDSALGNASIRGADGLSAGFTPDVDGIYYLDLSASLQGLSVTDRVVITVDYDLNRPPEAQLYLSSPYCQPGQSIELTPSCNDLDYDEMSLSLSIASQPAGSALFFAPDEALHHGEAIPSVSLTPLVPGRYAVGMAVTDGKGARTYIERSFIAKAPNLSGNTSPIANAGDDFFYPQGGGIIQTNAVSYDLDGDPLSYSWKCISHPAAYPALEAAAFSQSGPGLTVYPSIPAGDYVYELTVNDGTTQGEGDEPPTDTDTVTFTVQDVPAFINTARIQARDASLGTEVAFAVELDPDPDILYGLPGSANFAFVSRPAASASLLSFSPPANPRAFYGQFTATFIPDVPGTYVVMATIRDYAHTFTRTMSVAAVEDGEGVIDVSIY